MTTLLAHSLFEIGDHVHLQGPLSTLTCRVIKVRCSHLDVGVIYRCRIDDNPLHDIDVYEDQMSGV